MVQPPPRIGIQLVYTDDTGTSLTDRDRLCFVCCTTDERTWRRRSNVVQERSSIAPRASKIKPLRAHPLALSPGAVPAQARPTLFLDALPTLPQKPQAQRAGVASHLTMISAFSCAFFRACGGGDPVRLVSRTRRVLVF
ncbi:hypothetical protein K438DRAFT_1810298 [Mycena galopus ATCC 62051]|nr:hypothetical protein K438DRAFT_1810298 [Mycena galopus ATCC 62051]